MGKFRKLEQNPSVVGAGIRFRIDRRAPDHMRADACMVSRDSRPPA
jgi:hypothetical protein